MHNLNTSGISCAQFIHNRQTVFPQFIHNAQFTHNAQFIHNLLTMHNLYTLVPPGTNWAWGVNRV